MKGFGTKNPENNKQQRHQESNQSINELTSHALKAYQNKDIDGARRSCRLILTNQPQNAPILGFLAIIEKQLGNLKESYTV